LHSLLFVKKDADFRITLDQDHMARVALDRKESTIRSELGGMLDATIVEIGNYRILAGSTRQRTSQFSLGLRWRGTRKVPQRSEEKQQK